MFSTSTAFMAAIDGVPHALVTQPNDSTAHEYRWSTATLACSDLVFGVLVLPDDVDSSQPFMMSSRRVDSAISGAKAVDTQYGYVGSLTAPDRGFDEDGDWRMARLVEEDLEETMALLERGYARDATPDPDLSEQRTELTQILKNDAGWCWVARSVKDSSVCGMVSYIAMHIELAGIPGVLVSDLVVDPSHRRKGLAVLMQRHACSQLHQCGMRFVFGNVRPENDASRRQAESLDRTVWYRSVVFRPAGFAGAGDSAARRSSGAR